MRSCALLVAVTVAAAAFVSTCCRPAQALTAIPPPTTTVAGTCQAAHDADSRVSATFCSTHLGKEPSAINADTRGLAEAAAVVGVRNADAARSKTHRTPLRRRDEGNDEEDDSIYRGMLERCDMVYGIIRGKYAAARQAIAERRYGAVESELSSVPWLGHACDSGFALARRAGASPFLPYGEDNTQIALLTLAITGLIIK